MRLAPSGLASATKDLVHAGLPESMLTRPLGHRFALCVELIPHALEIGIGETLHVILD